jgi:hemerythrin-like metal-binding protein
MDTVKEMIDAVSLEAVPIRTAPHGPQPPAPSPIDPEDLQRAHRELFTWLTDYTLAVAEGANRNHLLATFDATFECVRKHFRSVEALLAQVSWPSLQRHYLIHRQIAEELAAYRMRLAGNDPLDAVECAHVLDAVLIQFIREQPLFSRVYAPLDHLN